MIFETIRLLIRKAEEKDTSLFYSLWTDDEVMKFVGFPKGLKITEEEIKNSILKQSEGHYNKPLVIQLKDTGEFIGECKLGLPDKHGIAETDVKLFPLFQGKGYGKEVKKGLIDYLFTHTDCTGIKATPNKLNIASQKMQESVGASKIGEASYKFPEHMREYTEEVHFYIYILYRKDWESYRKKGE
ncbi:MAG: GNAT family protein [Candidatus Eremiobacterota bacterium]